MEIEPVKVLPVEQILTVKVLPTEEIVPVKVLSMYQMVPVTVLPIDQILTLKVLFTNPSARAGYDTRSIFKRSLTGFEFRVFLLLD